MPGLAKRFYGIFLCLLGYGRFGRREIAGFSDIKVGMRMRWRMLSFGQFPHGQVVTWSLLIFLCMILLFLGPVVSEVLVK